MTLLADDLHRVLFFLVWTCAHLSPRTISQPLCLALCVAFICRFISSLFTSVLVLIPIALGMIRKSFNAFLSALFALSCLCSWSPKSTNVEHVSVWAIHFLLVWYSNFRNLSHFNSFRAQNLPENDRLSVSQSCRRF